MTIKHILFQLCTMIVLTSQALSQIDFTANDEVPTYTGTFNIGCNGGYYGSNWTDGEIADMLIGNEEKSQPGIGMNSLRPTLPETFLDKWGYTIRESTFEHYGNIRAENNTVFLQTPADATKENKEYCPGKPSKLWANMFEPIWDNGENGTPVNEKNYMALYIYNTATIYTKNVRFWEVINEPDYTTSNNGWRASGDLGNWWDNDPPPCETTRNLAAPISHYVRALRIAYEVIKYVDPDDYVCTGGIGYNSFLDAILRNTDNPDQGKVTSEYPLKGGAYFDCVSYHHYPMYSLREWKNGTWIPKRHSDEAVKTLLDKQVSMQELLAEYGYDNVTYPQKHFIVTETNVDSKPFSDYIGSDEAQRNYTMKSILKSQTVLDALHFFVTADAKEADATSSYSTMGFFKNISDIHPFEQTIKMSGIGMRTLGLFVKDKTYSSDKTDQLDLPEGIDGAAFKDADGKYVYAIWAKTTQDNNENAEQPYSFPASFKANTIKQYGWDFAETNTVKTISDNKVTVYGYPSFFETDEQVITKLEGLSQPTNVKVYPNPATNVVTIELHDSEEDISAIGLYEISGKVLSTGLKENGQGSTVNISTVGLKANTYILKITTNKSVRIARIVVE